MYFFKNILTKNGRRFVLYHVGAVIMFTFLYYIQDYFITNNFELAKKLYLVDKNKHQSKDDKVNSIYYYLWFSLITQSTVGYSGILNEETGQNIPFSKIHEIPYRVFNVTQLLSIFFITAYLM